MTTITETAAMIEAREEVASAKIWNDSRIYITFAGRNFSKAGDKNLKFWFDAKDGRYHIDGWKGNMSSEFSSNFYKFCREFAPYIVSNS